MRKYAATMPGFWTGKTARRIKGLPSPLRERLQVMMHYLISGPASTMIGLYYIPLPSISYETGMPLEGASESLAWLMQEGFAYYDFDSEIAWVPEMAVFQVGESLPASDKRCKGTLNLARKYAKSPFFYEFILRYREAFNLDAHMTEREIEGASMYLASSLEREGASKGHLCQEQEQEQEQGQYTQNPYSSSLDSLREESSKYIYLNKSSTRDAYANTRTHARVIDNQHPSESQREIRRENSISPAHVSNSNEPSAFDPNHENPDFNAKNHSANEDSKELSDALNAQDSAQNARVEDFFTEKSVPAPEILPAENRAETASEAFQGSEGTDGAKQSHGDPVALEELPSELSSESYEEVKRELEEGNFPNWLMSQHPRAHGGHMCQTYILEALERETLRFKNEQLAALYLTQKTRIYAECVSRWPAGEMKHVVGSVRFYGESIYNQDERIWENDEQSGNREKQRERRILEVVGSVGSSAPAAGDTGSAGDFDVRAAFGLDGHAKEIVRADPRRRAALAAGTGIRPRRAGF